MWVCTNCGEKVEDDFEVCWNCETQNGSLASESYFTSTKSQPIIEEEPNNGPKTCECEACRAEIRFEDPVCPKCGADITEVVDSDEETIVEDETAVIEKRKESSLATIPNQAAAVMKRYKDAYIVARVTNTFGGMIKATGIIIGGLLTLARLMVTGSMGQGTLYLS